MARLALTVVAGPRMGHQAIVDDELILGRGAGEGPGVLGEDRRLSRRHARVRLAADGGLLLDDLGSTNGTLVNGRRLQGVMRLHPGDRIFLGSTEMLVEQVASLPAAPVVVPPPAPAAPQPPPSRLPPFPSRPPPPPEPPRRGARVAVATVLVLLTAAIATLGSLYAIERTSENGGENLAAAPSPSPFSGDPTRTSPLSPPPPEAAAGFDGTVYLQSNASAPNANSVLALRYRAGSLRPLRIAEYPTGGSGSRDLTDSGVLDAEGQIVVNPDRTLLFSVNQGSDTVAVFRIVTGGALEAVPGSPFPSGGAAPAALGLRGDVLVVVNKAHDGIRRLERVAPNLTTFRVGADGRLEPLGEVVALPPASSPTQALVMPLAPVVMTSEEHGPFSAFVLGEDGSLRAGPNTPLAADPSIFTPEILPRQRWGLGMAAHPTQPLVYVQMAPAAKLAVYEYEPSGALRFVTSLANRGSLLPCWSVMSADGSRLYTANAASNTVSVFDTGTDARRPRQMQSIRMRGPGNPWHLSLDPTGRFLFVITPRDRPDIPPGRGNTLHSLRVAADGTLVELDSSPVPLPVPLGTNPQGIAVLPAG